MLPWPVAVMNSLSDAITTLDSYISFFGVVEAIIILNSNMQHQQTVWGSQYPYSINRHACKGCAHAVQCLLPAYNSITSWIIVLVWFCGLGINGWVPTHYLARYDATHQDMLHHFKLRPLCLYSLLHLWAIMHCTLLRTCRSPVNIITVSNDKGLSSGKLLHAMKESNVDRTEVSVCTYYMCVPLNLLHVPLIWLADSMLLNILFYSCSL